VDVLGLSLRDSGLALLLPYLMPFLGANAAGAAADALVRRGWRVVVVRKSFQATSDVGQARPPPRLPRGSYRSC
jgi:hypothetical protein